MGICWALGGAWSLHTLCKMADDSKARRKVLVEYNERRKIICFSGDGTLDEFKKEAIIAYADILKSIEYQHNLVFQIKSEEWDGKFIDLEADEIIPDKAIIRLMIEPVCRVNK